MRLPGADTFLQTDNISSYAVTKNFEGLYGNPWLLSVELPVVEDVDFSTYNISIVVYDEEKQIIRQTMSYASPLEVTISSLSTKMLLPGIYEYAIIAFTGTGVDTKNYTIARGRFTSIANRWIEGEKPITIRIVL